MLSRFKDKMTYANVASTAALVIAVAGGGAATAAALIPNNSVNSAKIVNNSVKSIDVKNDNLKGTDINEGTLGQVPSAVTADVASGVVFGTIDDNSFDPGAVGVVKGYAWMNSPGATANPLNNSYLFNSAGGDISSTRNGTGSYSVTFANLDIFPGHVQVTAYGGGTAACKVVSWGGSTANVACFNDAGAAVDSMFTVAMIE